MSRLDYLSPAQRFMYEYGSFAAFWSNLEILLEVAIWDLSGNDAKLNCQEINPKTAGPKKQILERLLIEKGMVDAQSALTEVFNVAERNDWLHGHIFNPKGDFSVLTRLRVTVENKELSVSNTQINFETSPFQAFYTAFSRLQESLKLSEARCNEYINLIQA
jgi:hypothetical protein